MADDASFGAMQVPPQTLNKSEQDKLKQIVARIETLEAEKKQTADDIKDVYAEAKAFGYDTKVLRQVIRVRKQDRQEREEQEMIMDLYLGVLGEN
jgi:uncharacterized protein (UPF0335 family)